MNDPYQVLGVSQFASDKEIKSAYRELARKYHPDNYHNNPLADLAQEKMKEINEAYDTIMRLRGFDGTGRNSRSAGSGRTYSTGSSEGLKVRAAISSGDLQYAEQLLIAFADKNAEWNFLMGSLCYRRGRLDEAMTFYNIAVTLEPNNLEYRQALTFMQQGGRAYQPFATHAHGLRVGCSVCNCCATLLCLRICCHRR